MATPLLTTKLHIPPVRPDLVQRPCLIECLSDGLHRRLTVITAPAGFGKTTLISDWLARVEQPSTWLSLDRGDNDLARFLTYVIAALRQINAGLVQTIGQVSPSPDVERIITSIINETAALGSSFIFVLDDYHSIKLPAIHQAMGFLLDHMPFQAGMHLVIASRADPPLPLPRLRVQREVTEVRESDLRFSEAEVAAFFNQAMGLDLPPEAISALESRTEGWIAGLQLAALALQDLVSQGTPTTQEKSAERISSFIQAFTGSHRYVVDYLVEEVLKRRPPGTKSFLLQTSILDRFTGPLCDAVCGTSRGDTSEYDGQETLKRLNQANLFLVPLDHERRWYRYHHLFAELLRNQLKVSWPELVPTLHRRASEWYAQNGFRTEAIAHSLAAEDFERVVQLTLQTIDDLMGRDEFFTNIIDWLDELPEEIVRADPRLGIIYAWMQQITIQFDAAESRLQAVESLADGPLPPELELQVAMVRANLARQRGDRDRALELSYQVLDALGDPPLAEHLLPVYTSIVFNVAYVHLFLEGDMVKARQRVSETLALSQAAGSTTLTLAVMKDLAQIQTWQGQLHQAAETYRRGLEIAAQVAQQSRQVLPAAAYVHLGLGDILREWNRLDEAAHHLERGLDLSRQWQIGEMLADGYFFQARLKQAQGDMAGAMDTVRKAEQLPLDYQTVSRFGGRPAACRALLKMIQAVSSKDVRRLDARHLEAVEKWAEECGLGADMSRMSAVRIDSMNDEFEYLIGVRLLIAQNKPDHALQVLGCLELAAEDGGRTGRVIEILVLQALAHRARADTERALAILERALSLAEPQGYVRLFVDEGAPMARLLCQATSQRIAPDYVDKLLAAMDLGTTPKRLSGVPLLLEPLSDRELDVLRLLNTDLSGPEIAAELVVSVNTVRTHIRRIYSKLDVHSRYEAVVRADELDLL